MYSIRRRLYSQNFLHNRKLIVKLLGYSSIGKDDLVLEIGPGKGIITEQLVKRANRIIAVEADKICYKYLQFRFQNINNLTLIKGDFLNSYLPELPYKVFANIPFSIEGKIIRKLIDAKNPPDDCCLVVRMELAYRLSALYRENMFSIMHKPWFVFSIPYRFKRTDFNPVPRINAVLFSFVKRMTPLLPIHEKIRYQKFVYTGFTDGLPISHNLSKRFGKIRLKRVINKLKIPRHVKPNELTLEQWIYLYKALEEFS